MSTEKYPQIQSAERLGLLSILGHDNEYMWVAFAGEMSDELAGELVSYAHEHGLAKVYVRKHNGDDEKLLVCGVYHGGGQA